MHFGRALLLCTLVSTASAQGVSPETASLFASSCTDNSRIEPSKRSEIELTAMDFLKKLLSETPEAAYSLLSADATASVSQDQLVQQATLVLRRMEVKEPAVTKTYLVHVTGKVPQRVVCGELADDKWDSVGAVTTFPEQAHVVISATTVNNKVAFMVWLVRPEKKWLVQSYWMNVATLADKGPGELRHLGREQLARRHFFNATLLYAAALQIANRGPNFQMGITQSLTTEMSQVTIPKEVQGQPPFDWSDGTNQYKVLNVGPMAIGGKIYVAINHQVSPWTTDKQVDGWNRQLIAYFKARFPEYKDTFAGIIVHAVDRGSNRGYGTVEEN
jgi:hypothetical protein